MAAPYSRETIDAKLDGLEARIMVKFGEVDLKIETLRGEFRTDFASLRGEWKVWMLVMGTVLAVLSSGVGNRVLELVWPAGPNGPPGATVPR